MENQELIVQQPQEDALLTMDYDNLVMVANRADTLVSSLNKIMSAALKITTAKDWCNIGGTPYLQESGATKVARLFGISTRIHEGYPKCERDENGYPTYYYRMTFSLGSQSIEADGARSAKDEFFAGKGRSKTPDEIPLDDVQRAAYTNCMNNGIKRLIPGLRNLDIEDLENAGIDIKNKSSGYSFRTGSKGGNSGKAKDSGLVCSACGAPIPQNVASYSEGKFGRMLCMKCQDAARAGTLPPPAQDAEFEELPPHDDADLPFK